MVSPLLMKVAEVIVVRHIGSSCERDVALSLWILAALAVSYNTFNLKFSVLRVKGIE